MKSKTKRPLMLIISLAILSAFDVCIFIISKTNDKKALFLLIFTVCIYVSMMSLIIMRRKKENLLLPLYLLLLISIINIIDSITLSSPYRLLELSSNICALCIFISLPLLLLVETQKDAPLKLRNKKNIVKIICIAALIFFCILATLSSLLNLLSLDKGYTREILKHGIEILTVIPTGVYVYSLKNYISRDTE